MVAHDARFVVFFKPSRNVNIHSAGAMILMFTVSGDNLFSKTLDFRPSLSKRRLRRNRDASFYSHQFLTVSTTRLITWFRDSMATQSHQVAQTITNSAPQPGKPARFNAAMYAAATRERSNATSLWPTTFGTLRHHGHPMRSQNQHLLLCALRLSCCCVAPWSRMSERAEQVFM